MDAAEKVAEVEMKDLTPAEVQDDNDEEKIIMEGTKEAEKKSEETEVKKVFRSKTNAYSKLKNSTENIRSLSMPASTPKCDEGQEKGEEIGGGNVYSKLKNPSENVCMTAMASSSPKHKDVSRKIRLYKRISAVFIILSLLLLAVVLALALMFTRQDGQSSQNYPEERISAEVQEVQNKQSLPQNPVYRLTDCGRGWIRYKNSCYFISKDRLSWQQSREKCQQKGGDLVVINSEIVQTFLNKHWGMVYWIGLRYSEEQEWMWINDTALIKSGSYWENGEPKLGSHGLCALLKGQNKQLNNWLTSSCVVVSQYICQRG